jgi:phage regulator Rha-like protein
MGIAVLEMNEKYFSSEEFASYYNLEHSLVVNTIRALIKDAPEFKKHFTFNLLNRRRNANKYICIMDSEGLRLVKFQLLYLI